MFRICSFENKVQGSEFKVQDCEPLTVNLTTNAGINLLKFSGKSGIVPKKRKDNNHEKP
jgi:hypothetical protein